MTHQQQMEAKLKQLGIAYRSIKCFGSSILIHCECRDSAERFQMALNNFCRKTHKPVLSISREHGTGKTVKTYLTGGFI